MRLKFTSIIVASLFLLLAFFETANAQQAYVGGVLGLSVPDFEGTSSRPMYGILGGAKLGGEFRVGGYFLTATKEESFNNQDVDFDYSLYGAEVAYHFEGLSEYAYVAVRLGITKWTLGDSDLSPTHYGLAAGYDHMLTDRFSIGGELSYMSVGSDKDGLQEFDSFSVFSYALMLKAWF